MSDCSSHKREVAGIGDMKVLADMIGDLHYDNLYQLLYHLSKKLEADAVKDALANRDKLASALQYTGLALFESALRAEKVWKICKPFMNHEKKS